MKNKFEEAQKLRNNGQIEEAVKLYNEIREENLIANPQIASECSHMIGVAYYQDQKFKRAMESLLMCLDEYTQLVDQEAQGFVLRDLGIVARAEKDFVKAEKYLRESVEKLKKAGNLGHEGMSRVKLGRVFADQGKFEEAYLEINKGIELLKKSSDKFFLSSAYIDRAKVDVENSLSILNSFSSQDEFKQRRKEIKKILDS